MKRFLLLSALLVSACGNSQSPAPAAAPQSQAQFAPLIRRVLESGTDGVIPPSVCIMLKLEPCAAPKVKSIVVMWGDQAKFAQVFLDHRDRLALGIRRQSDATMFITDESGTLYRGLSLDLQSLGHVMNASEADPIFEKEKAFWQSWLADPGTLIQAPSGVH